MAKRSEWRVVLLGFLCLFQLLASAPAQASSFAAINSNILALFQASGAPNQCVSYTYDKNGNITVRINQTYTSQPSWGVALFGCFSWSSS